MLHRDGDSVINAFDNCIDVPNADQSDVDNDGKGNNVVLTHFDVLKLCCTSNLKLHNLSALPRDIYQSLYNLSKHPLPLTKYLYLYCFELNTGF